MAKRLGIDKINEAIGLCEIGHSLEEISNKLKIAKKHCFFMAQECRFR